jgi:hypothetical protein
MLTTSKDMYNGDILAVPLLKICIAVISGGAWRKTKGGPVACNVEQSNKSLAKNVTVK